MKEELKKLIKQFLAETESERTGYTEEHDIPFVTEPTFRQFIEWLET